MKSKVLGASAPLRFPQKSRKQNPPKMFVHQNDSEGKGLEKTMRRPPVTPTARWCSQSATKKARAALLAALLLSALKLLRQKFRREILEAHRS